MLGDGADASNPDGGNNGGDNNSSAATNVFSFSLMFIVGVGIF